MSSGSLRLGSEGTCAKGVSSTLGRNDPEKKLLKFLAGGFSGSCFLPIFLETGRDFGAAAPLKRPLVNLEIAEVPLRFAQTPRRSLGTCLALATKMPSHTLHCHPLPLPSSPALLPCPPPLPSSPALFPNRHELMRGMGD